MVLGVIVATMAVVLVTARPSEVKTVVDIDVDRWTLALRVLDAELESVSCVWDPDCVELLLSSVLLLLLPLLVDVED